MKEVNSYGWKAVIGSSIGYAMDGFDLLILGFMLTLISGDLGLTTGQAGSLGDVDLGWCRTWWFHLWYLVR